MNLLKQKEKDVSAYIGLTYEGRGPGYRRTYHVKQCNTGDVPARKVAVTPRRRYWLACGYGGLLTAEELRTSPDNSLVCKQRQVFVVGGTFFLLTIGGPMNLLKQKEKERKIDR